LFVSVTVFAELVLPTAVLLKVSDVADRVTGALPVPVRVTVCGLFRALSVKVSVPVAAPIAVGENVTPTTQLAPAAMLVPQVLLATAKPALATMPLKLSAALARFVSVTVLAALVLPTASVPKLRLLEESVTGALPVPVRPTVWVPALSPMASVPENDPMAVGANETEIVQEAAGAMLALQVLVWLKGAATVTVETCIGPVPVLVNVTVLAVLVVPSICEEKLTLVGLSDATGAVPVPLSATDCVVPRL